MAVLLYNHDEGAAVHPAGTWGELLDALDERARAGGEVVTAVRLNGVDEPTFRSSEALATPLDPDTEVVVETARPGDLIRHALDEACRAATAIRESTARLADACRRNDAAASSRELGKYAASIGLLLLTTRTVAQGASVDLTMVGDGELSAADLVSRLLHGTDRLVSAQRRGDWAGVASVVEDDVDDVVRRWPLVLDAIRHAVPPPLQPTW